MVEKEYVQQLLQTHQSFVIFGTEEEFFFPFTWDEKKKEYKEYKNLYKKCGWQKEGDIMEVFFEGRPFEVYLKEASILQNCSDEKMEEEIIKGFIRKDYQERSRYLLSGKKRDRFADMIQHNKEALNMKRAEKLESLYNLRPKLPEEWERKRMGKREGYLMTGFFDVNTYKGRMEILLDFMETFATFDMGILYCPQTKSGIMQFDRETSDGRWYWLE